MSTFAWKDDFRTGIEEMDKHHKKFFDYLTQLEQAAGGNKGKEIIERGLKLADDYVRFHFAEEEKLLEITGFPGLDHQRKEHTFFARQVNDLRDRYAKGDSYLPISALAFLRDWFSHHIIEEDKKYGEYLSGVEEEPFRRSGRR
jgi:hemerythrin